jgi:hypothetical protein
MALKNTKSKFPKSTQIEDLLTKIYEDVFNVLEYRSTIIFLCGADIQNSNSIRAQLKTRLEKSNPTFYIYYPEMLFKEDINVFKKSKYNLLDIENQIAEEAHCICIVCESHGSVCELGAFSNCKEISQKIINILDVEYEFDDSFINLGPNEMLKKHGENRVIFLDPNNLDTSIERIGRSIRAIPKSNSKVQIGGFVGISHLLLLLIYINGNIKFYDLKYQSYWIFDRGMGDYKEREINSIDDFAKFKLNPTLGLLIESEGKVSKNDDKCYVLSSLGHTFIETIIRNTAKSNKISEVIGNIRLGILHNQYYNDKAMLLRQSLDDSSRRRG